MIKSLRTFDFHIWVSQLIMKHALPKDAPNLKCHIDVDAVDDLLIVSTDRAKLHQDIEAVVSSSHEPDADDSDGVSVSI